VKGVYRARGLVTDDEQGLLFSDPDGEQMGMTSLLEVGFLTFCKNLASWIYLQSLLELLLDYSYIIACAV
jgi:hypothetical protein